MKTTAEKILKAPTTAKRLMTDAAVMTASAALFSFGVRVFISPNGIAPGGVTGLAVIMSQFWDVGVGTFILLLNIPLLAAGFFLLDRTTMLKTMFSVAVITVFTDLAEMYLPYYDASESGGLVAAVFGGAAVGTGLGLCYKRGSTSGGIDIIIKLIIKLFPGASLGAVHAILDAAVVALSLAVFGNADNALYSLAAIFVQARMIDVIVYSGGQNKFILIFSEKAGEITDRLLGSGCGVTVFKAEGAYSGEKQDVIATAVRRTSYSGVKRAINETDPAAFVVTANTDEVLGKGFSEA